MVIHLAVQAPTSWLDGPAGEGPTMNDAYMALYEALQATLSGDVGVRNGAERTLKQMALIDIIGMNAALVKVIMDNSAAYAVRQAGAVHLRKTAVAVTEDVRQAVLCIDDLRLFRLLIAAAVEVCKEPGSLAPEGMGAGLLDTLRALIADGCRLNDMGKIERALEGLCVLTQRLRVEALTPGYMADLVAMEAPIQWLGQVASNADTPDHILLLCMRTFSNTYASFPTTPPLEGKLPYDPAKLTRLERPFVVALLQRTTPHVSWLASMGEYLSMRMSDVNAQGAAVIYSDAVRPLLARALAPGAAPVPDDVLAALFDIVAAFPDQICGPMLEAVLPAALHLCVAGDADIEVLEDSPAEYVRGTHASARISALNLITTLTRSTRRSSDDVIKLLQDPISAWVAAGTPQHIAAAARVLCGVARNYNKSAPQVEKFFVDVAIPTLQRGPGGIAQSGGSSKNNAALRAMFATDVIIFVSAVATRYTGVPRADVLMIFARWLRASDDTGATGYAGDTAVAIAACNGISRLLTPQLRVQLPQAHVWEVVLRLVATLQVEGLECAASTLARLLSRHGGALGGGRSVVDVVRMLLDILGAAAAHPGNADPAAVRYTFECIANAMKFDAHAVASLCIPALLHISAKQPDSMSPLALHTVACMIGMTPNTAVQLEALAAPATSFYHELGGLRTAEDLKGRLDVFSAVLASPLATSLESPVFDAIAMGAVRCLETAPADDIDARTWLAVPRLFDAVFTCVSNRADPRRADTTRFMTALVSAAFGLLTTGVLDQKAMRTARMLTHCVLGGVAMHGAEFLCACPPALSMLRVHDWARESTFVTRRSAYALLRMCHEGATALPDAHYRTIARGLAAALARLKSYDVPDTSDDEDEEEEETSESDSSDVDGDTVALAGFAAIINRTSTASRLQNDAAAYVKNARGHAETWHPFVQRLSTLAGDPEMSGLFESDLFV